MTTAFRCNRCNCIFPSVSALSNHSRIHQMSCAVTIEHDGRTIKHVLTRDSDAVDFIAPCGQSYPRPLALQRHVKDCRACAVELVQAHTDHPDHADHTGHAEHADYDGQGLVDGSRLVALDVTSRNGLTLYAYDTVLKLVLCLPCRYFPQNIRGHARCPLHRCIVSDELVLPDTTTTTIATNVDQFIPRPPTVAHYFDQRRDDPPPPPIPCLPVLSGMVCSVADCAFVAVSAAGMAAHYRSVHPSQSMPSEPSPVSVQQLTRGGPCRCYVRVRDLTEHSAAYACHPMMTDTDGLLDALASLSRLGRGGAVVDSAADRRRLPPYVLVLQIDNQLDAIKRGGSEELRREDVARLVSVARDHHHHHHPGHSINDDQDIETAVHRSAYRLIEQVNSQMARSHISQFLRDAVSLRHTGHDAAGNAGHSTFRPVFLPSTLSVYALVATRLVMMLFRCIIIRADSSPFLPLDLPAVVDCVRSLYAAVLADREHHHHPTDTDTDTALFKLLSSLLCLDISLVMATNELVCPVRRFICCYTIHPDGGRFRPACDMTPMLAALLFVFRCVALREAQSVIGNIGGVPRVLDYGGPKQHEHKLQMDRVRAVFHYVRDDNELPFAYICRIMRLCAANAWSTPAYPSVSWHDVDGQSLEITATNVVVSLRALAVLINTLMTDATRWLGQLTYSYDGLSRVCVSAGIMDRQSNYARGYSLLDDDNLAAERHAFFSWLTSTNRSALFRHPDHLSRWLAKVDRLTERLWVLIHLVAGLPGRAPELASIQIRNTDSLRGVFRIHDSLVLVTTYHKSMSKWAAPKPVARSLPPALANLLLRYLVFVRDLATIATWRIHGESAAAAIYHSVLFVRNGAAMSPQALCDVFSAVVATHGFPRLNVSGWRHASIAFMRHHLGAFRELQEQQQGEPLSSALDAQSAHTTATAEAAYALSTTDLSTLSPQLLLRFMQCSNAWARLLVRNGAASLGLADDGDCDSDAPSRRHHHRHHHHHPHHHLDPSLLHPRDRLLLQPHLSNQPHHHPTNPLAATTPLTTALLPTPSDAALVPVLAQLRILVRDPSASFREPSHVVAIAHVLEGNHDILLVAATGSGKSLAFMIAAALDRRRCTVVVVPLKSLLHDLHQRCIAAGITNTVIYNTTTESTLGHSYYCCYHAADLKNSLPNILLVAVEDTGCHRLHSLLGDMHADHRLARIVYDEAHEIEHSRDYRAAMSFAPNLRAKAGAYGVPLLLLSATVPPAMVAELRSHFYAPSLVVFRSPSVRPELEMSSYAVGNQSQLAAKVTELVLQFLGQDSSSSNVTGIVFTRSRAHAHQLCDAWQAPDRPTADVYTAELTGDQRGVAHAAFATGQTRVLFATTAFGLGVSINHCRFVVLAGAPYSLLDAQQQCGRAGRDGSISPVVIVHNNTADLCCLPPTATQKDRDNADAVHRWLTSNSCLRAGLGRYIDGDALSCIRLGECAFCDRCSRELSPPAKWTRTHRGRSALQVAEPMMPLLPVPVAIAAITAPPSPSPPPPPLIPTTSSQIAIDAVANGELQLALVRSACVAVDKQCFSCRFRPNVSQSHPPVAPSPPHRFVDCPKLRGACFVCSHHGHRLSQCPFKLPFVDRAVRLCSRCLMPDLDSAIVLHPEEGFSTKKCSNPAAGAIKFLPIALRSDQYPGFLDAFQLHDKNNSDALFSAWMYDADELGVTNAARVLVWYCQQAGESHIVV